MHHINNSITPVVSIITPCYNGEKFVQRFLDSILAQTYKSIELIFINDGSTDDTEKIVLSYTDNFKRIGIRLVYIYQENQGLGGAINSGLKKVSGKYMCWPDSDDFLEPKSIELRVDVLEKNLDFAVVTSDAYIRSIDNLEKPLGLVSKSYNTNNDHNQFMHLLNGRSIFCSGSHMVRTKEFFETHIDKEIFPARRGQNWQMLLPVYYKYKRYYLDKPLYNYIKYNSSMSRIDDMNLEETIFRNNDHRGILLETLSRMKVSKKEKEYYKNLVNNRYSYMNFIVAIKHRNSGLIKQEYNNLKRLGTSIYKLKLIILFLWIKHFLSFIFISK